MEKFRLRRPSMSIWNPAIKPGDEVAAWKDALDFVAAVKPENLSGFRIEINKKKERNAGS